MAEILKFDPSCVPLLTSAQAAALVGLSRSSLNKMRVYGSGPIFAKLGRSVRYRRNDLDSWVAGRLIGSTSDDRAPHRLRDRPEPAKRRQRRTDTRGAAPLQATAPAGRVKRGAFDDEAAQESCEHINPERIAA